MYLVMYHIQQHNYLTIKSETLQLLFLPKNY